MNLLPDLLSHPEISLFLRAYPQPHWFSVLRATILYGIASLRALQAAGLPVNVLDDHSPSCAQTLADTMIPNIKGKLQHMKGQLDEIAQCLGDTPQPPLTDALQREDRAMARSNSVPIRGKRGQPNQGKKDYAPLIYPEWWPMDTSSGSSSGKPAYPPSKRTVKPKVYTSKGRTPVSTSQDPKPLTKTIGTSTHSHSSAKPLKMLAQPVYDSPRPLTLRPELRETRSQTAITPSSSGSSKESRLRPSVPSSEETDGQRSRRNEAGTVKRSLGTTWAGDFTKVVKRSSDKKEVERTLQESRGKTSLSELRRKREEDRDAVKLDISSDSSISTYHPSEELKAFYRNEHERLCPKPETRQSPQVSVSAQFYRNSESSGRSGSEQAEDRDSDSFARY